MQNFNFFIGYPNPLTPVQVPQPDNWTALELELSYENLSPDAVFNSTKLIWQGANAEIMNDWLAQGLVTGGLGIFEGLPFISTVCNSNQVVFNGIIDLTDVDTKFSCDIVQVKIRDKRMDMVSQLMDSISYSYLTSIPGQAGYIKPGNLINGTGDYLPIAYQRNDIPSLESVMTLILILWDIYQIIEEIVAAIEEVVAAVTQAIGGFPSPGAIAAGGLEAILWLAYATALTLILFSLLQAAVNCLVSPVLQKYGMYARTLMQKACDYFGLQFTSTILSDPNSEYYNTVIMPSKSAWENSVSWNVNILTLGNVKHLTEYDDDYNLSHGGSAYGYYDGTPGDLIRSLENVFNARAKIILDPLGNPVLHFERWDYQYDLATYTLPDISDQTPFNSHGLFNSTGRSQSAFGTNASEIISNYNIRYALDTSDLNTYNFYDGNSCDVITQPNTVSTQQNVLLQGLKEVNLEFSHVKRKETETAMEEFFEDAYAVVYVFYVIGEVLSLGALSAANLPSPPLGFTSIGHMLLSEDTTDTPKIFIAGAAQTYNGISLSAWGGRSFTAVTVDPNNKGASNMSVPNLSARSLYKNFHYSTQAVSITPNNSRYSSPYTPNSTHYNQWLIYRDQEMPLCCADYTLIKNNNFLTTINGSPAKADTLKWNPFNERALIDYRVNQQYTKNLNITFVVDGVDTFDLTTI